MGGTVSLLVALNFPNLVEKIVVIGSPIQGKSLSFPLKLAGEKYIAVLLFRYFNLFRKSLKKVSPIICNDPRFPEIIDRDLSKTNLESFLNSINSLSKVDLRTNLNNVKIPVLGLYGKRDNIVSPEQYKPLQQGIPHTQIQLFSDSGHFIMLEEPKLFLQLIHNFLNQETVI